eukprot:CAMPEP_0201489516 /NCGR_PEP_ID=MMETSP0151_2-20130828/22851_1 /ASSEMBLY_ACC=CAM_ASM_000257 /TAXON_ID=200890 /ORGANISM="Paramoeba atlantica, Strain 621/1 / CCAP 1560/9" /LENGTH=480 /DNA_ID=CAMNT_0047875133 /DNA_START=44 /DNA_END=1486 /DNA_ORIENTATION=-
MAFFFSRGKKSLMVKAEGCAETKELKFMERDSVEKIIDKIREKFELTEEQTQDWGLYAPLRNVWASPDQTVGDLLLRNGDSIYYHRRPLPNAQDGEKPAEMKEEDWVVMRSRQMPASSRDLTHDYRNTLMPDREAASTFRGKSALYPSPVGSSGIRASSSEGEIAGGFGQLDKRKAFLESCTYPTTGRANLKIPKSDATFIPQITSEARIKAYQPIPQVPGTFEELRIIQKYEDKGAREKEAKSKQKEELEIRKKLKERQMLEDLERIRRLEEEKARERKRLEEEMVRKREEERLREEQKRRQKQEEEDRRRADELRVREVEQQLISLAPASSQDALRIPKSRALYLVCVTDLNLQPAISAQVAENLSGDQEKVDLFFELLRMHIKDKIAFRVAMECRRLDEGINLALGLVPLHDLYPQLELEEIIVAYRNYSNQKELVEHLESYRTFKGMGFPRDQILVALQRHPSNNDRALEVLLGGV